MPRTPRIHFEGARHHVMNRTARKRVVFDNPGHILLFEALLSELPGRFSARVHAWALMGNHFHLLVDVPTDGLPRLMAWLTAQLARAVNQERGWDGPLFRGRYRNRVVVDDAYWRDVLAYLHLNPVRAGLVSNPDASLWTSHRYYAGLARPPAWMTTEELLGVYGGAETYRLIIEDIVRLAAKVPKLAGLPEPQYDLVEWLTHLVPVPPSCLEGVPPHRPRDFVAGREELGGPCRRWRCAWGGRWAACRHTCRPDAVLLLRVQHRQPRNVDLQRVPLGKRPNPDLLQDP